MTTKQSKVFKTEDVPGILDLRIAEPQLEKEFQLSEGQYSSLKLKVDQLRKAEMISEHFLAKSVQFMFLFIKESILSLSRKEMDLLKLF